MSANPREQIADWITEALKHLGGSGTVLEVAKELWRLHGEDIKRAGDLFYTWQYEMRWAAKILRDKKVLKAAEASARGQWELK